MTHRQMAFPPLLNARPTANTRTTLSAAASAPLPMFARYLHPALDALLEHEGNPSGRGHGPSGGGLLAGIGQQDPWRRQHRPVNRGSRQLGEVNLGTGRRNGSSGGA